MTDQEAWKLIYVLKATYPTIFRNYNTLDLDNLVTSWGMVFEDYSYEVVAQGLKVFLASDTKGFPPSPGQVMDCIVKLTIPEEITEGQAWDMVAKAAERGSVYCVEDFEKFPETVQKAVGSPSYLRRLATDEDINMSVEESNFQSRYRIILQRQREDAKIPESVRQVIKIALGEQNALEDKKGVSA